MRRPMAPGFRITDFPCQIKDLEESRVRNDGVTGPRPKRLFRTGAGAACGVVQPIGGRGDGRGIDRQAAVPLERANGFARAGRQLSVRAARRIALPAQVLLRRLDGRVLEPDHRFGGKLPGDPHFAGRRRRLGAARRRGNSIRAHGRARQHCRRQDDGYGCISHDQHDQKDMGSPSALLQDVGQQTKHTVATMRFPGY